jgi:hypothetical protein
VGKVLALIELDKLRVVEAVKTATHTGGSRILLTLLFTSHTPKFLKVNDSWFIVCGQRSVVSSHSLLFRGAELLSLLMNFVKAKSWHLTY